MWLPRLMRAATARQEIQTSGVGHLAQNMPHDFTALERERLAACTLPAFRMTAPTNYNVFRHFFVFFGWCCVSAFCAFILLLVSYISRETKESSKDFSKSLFLTAIFLFGILIYVAFRHLRAQLAFWRNSRDNGIRRCHNVTLSASFYFEPPSFPRSSQHFGYQLPVQGMGMGDSRNEFLVLPSYDDAIVEPVFAPPPYTATEAENFTVQEQNEVGLPSQENALIEESESSNNASGEKP